MVLPREELSRELLLQENERLALRVKVLEQQIEWLKKQIFGGGKGEHVDHDQKMLGLEGVESAPPEVPGDDQEITYTRKNTRKNGQAARERFDNVPVSETVEIVPEEVKADPDLYEQIGAEETFEIDIIAPKLVKRRLLRLKFRHLLDRSRPPVIAPAPQRPVQNSYASAGLIAWVVLSKYLDHLPLYRQQKMFERWGARISRQTMTDWVQVVAFWLKPLYNHMRKQLLAGGYVQADETPIRFQDPDNQKGKTSQGYLWVIHRPGLGVVFDWKLSRRHCEASALLKGFEGLLQTDGYDAYHALARDNDKIVHLSCWAHARRGFFHARTDNPREANLILGLIGRLYAMEDEYRQANLGAEDRRQRRQHDHLRILKWLKIVITIAQGRCLSQSNLGKACAYALGRWEQLCRYVEHGEAEIDNNLIENKIRPSALGKKNWLFIGSPEAGEHTATVYSMLLTCEIHGIDCHRWLRDVLSRIPTAKTTEEQIELLPYNWTGE